MSSSFSNYPHPTIAKEGWPFIALGFLVALSIQYFAGMGLISFFFWLLLVFIIQFFRDPARHVAGDTRTIVSPADGRVIVIEKAMDPYLQREALKISVFMNVFNVHSNRAPVDSVVQQKWYFPGQFFNAALDKASDQNERCALWLKTVDGHDVTCVQIAGLVARRILNYTSARQMLVRGQRYGFIRFGSRVDLYLPLNAHVCVALGDKVQASSSVLAELAI